MCQMNNSQRAKQRGVAFKFPTNQQLKNAQDQLYRRTQELKHSLWYLHCTANERLDFCLLREHEGHASRAAQEKDWKKLEHEAEVLLELVARFRGFKLGEKLADKDTLQEIKNAITLADELFGSFSVRVNPDYGNLAAVDAQLKEIQQQMHVVSEMVHELWGGYSPPVEYFLNVDPDDDVYWV